VLIKEPVDETEKKNKQGKDRRSDGKTRAETTTWGLRGRREANRPAAGHGAARSDAMRERENKRKKAEGPVGPPGIRLGKGIREPILTGYLWKCTSDSLPNRWHDEDVVSLTLASRCASRPAVRRTGPLPAKFSQLRAQLRTLGGSRDDGGGGGGGSGLVDGLLSGGLGSDLGGGLGRGGGLGDGSGLDGLLLSLLLGLLNGLLGPATGL
jgi:hypothetical protein